MSRIGKKPIQIESGVEVNIEKNDIKIKGPKGELKFKFSDEISVEKKDQEIIVTPKKKLKTTPAMWGLTRALIQNMIIGVTQGFEKKLEIQGVGYKAAIQGENIRLDVGFSHPVEFKVPSSLKVEVNKEGITISGINKQEVGQFAAKIRATRPPEPYKGKGIRYKGEKVRRKEGKKAATAKS